MPRPGQALVPAVAGSPRTVIYTVLASGPDHQARTRPAGGRQLLAVPQAFPGPRRIKRRPATVVRIVALVWTPREVGHAVRGDQNSRAIAMAFLRLSSSLCSQNSRSMSHNSQ